jgi:predicted restriction endonuclease
MKMEKRFVLTAKELKLHNEALTYARQHREAEQGLCRVLREIDLDKFYRKLGYARLFYYAVKELKLSESVANTTITVARKTRVIPELRAAVDQGQLSVSKASRIVSGLTKENASEVISFAQTHTSNEIDEEMARRNPEKPRRDSNRPIGNDKVELHVQISAATHKKLKRAQSLLASKGKPTNLDGVLSVCLDLYLDHHDPVRKAKRAEARAAQRAEQKTARPAWRNKEVQSENFAQHSMQNTVKTATAKTATAKPEPKTEQAKVEQSYPAASTEQLAEILMPTSASRSNTNKVIVESAEPAIAAERVLRPQEFCANRITDATSTKPDFKSSDNPATLRHRSSGRGTQRRKAIKAATHHAVMLRTGGRCAFVNERGERCNEDRFLHLHHIVPLSQGGSDDQSNLTCLCSGHHALAHQLSLALDSQITWLRSPQVAYRA